MTNRVVITGVAIDGPFGRTLDSLNVLLGNSHPAPRPVRRFPTNGCRVNVAHQHWPDGDTAAFFKGASATGDGSSRHRRVEGA